MNGIPDKSDSTLGEQSTKFNLGKRILRWQTKLHKGANPALFHYARLNRKVPTETEKILWHYLRNRKLKGFKFRRQHPIAHFIADFFCLESNLVIEMDSTYHNERAQREYDEGRMFELEELNVKVIRFTNEEVMLNTQFVLKEISKHLRPPDHSSSLSSRRGLG